MTRSAFTGMRPPRAPRELRSRVFAACARVGEPGRHPLDRVWDSTVARWAWALSVFLLIAALAARAPEPPTRQASDEFLTEIGEPGPGAGYRLAGRRTLWSVGPDRIRVAGEL